MNRPLSFLNLILALFLAIPVQAQETAGPTAQTRVSASRTEGAPLLPASRRARHKIVDSRGEVLLYTDSFDPNVITDDMPEVLKDYLRACHALARRATPLHSTRLQGKAVAPLLSSLRHQEHPYNLSCPYYRYEDGTLSQDPCVTGCVATALEQVVSYWRHPAALKDTLHGWETEHYTIPDILPGTEIDWDHILTNYVPGQYDERQAKAIADLTYYLGVAVQMNWTPHSSGARLSRAVETLYNAFDYKTVYFVQRGLFSNPAWHRLLRHELECGRPIVFTAHNYGLGGHAFNIDGVDEEGYYHVNMGEANYACYMDLDCIGYYMPQYDATDFDRLLSLNMNQTALFMHPDDFEIDISDSLRLQDALYGVRFDGVTFHREPDTKGYVRADFDLTNTTSDSLNFTFEVLTYLPTDTALFEQADYVALSSVNLAPHEHLTWPVFCHFSQTGERLFACSADDLTLPFIMPVRVEKGVSPKFTFTEPQVQLLRCRREGGEEDLVARVSFEAGNEAPSGVGYDVATYCLIDDRGEEVVRHFDFVEAAAGGKQSKQVDFHRLVDGKEYTFLLRYPWQVVRQFTFRMDASQATDGITLPLDSLPHNSFASSYDLMGRRTSSGFSGIRIVNGRKVMGRRLSSQPSL